MDHEDPFYEVLFELQHMEFLISSFLRLLNGSSFYFLAATRGVQKTHEPRHPQLQVNAP